MVDKNSNRSTLTQRVSQHPSHIFRRNTGYATFTQGLKPKSIKTQVYMQQEVSACRDWITTGLPRVETRGLYGNEILFNTFF